MAMFGRVVLALFAMLFAVALAAPRQPVFGFGKRNLQDSLDGGDYFSAYKRPMYFSFKGAKFHMGFGKRAGNRQFTMGFGKRAADLDNFETPYEY